MIIGVPSEVKTDEWRVALTPAGVRELTSAGHTVYVQKGAGEGSSMPDADFVRTGARILDYRRRRVDGGRPRVQGQGDHRAGVPLLGARQDQTLFTYLHLATSRECTDALVDAGNVAIAYETVRNGAATVAAAGAHERGGRAHGAAHGRPSPPCGRAGAAGCSSRVCPACAAPGSSSSVPASPASPQPPSPSACTRKCSSSTATSTACARSTITSTASSRPSRPPSTPLRRSASTPTSSSAPCSSSVPGAPPGLRHAGRADAPRFGPGRHRGGPGRLLRVDPAHHALGPDLEVHGSVFYCVANMPGAVPHTSTHALANATLPYVLDIANQGWQKGRAGQSRAGRRCERGRRPHRLQARGRRPRSAVHAAGFAARLTPRPPAAPFRVR